MFGLLLTKESFFRVRLPLGLLAVSTTMYASVIGYIFTSDNAKEMAYYLSHAPILLASSSIAALWSVVWGQMPTKYLERTPNTEVGDPIDEVKKPTASDRELVLIKEWMVIIGLCLSLGTITITLYGGSAVIIGMARSYETDSTEKSAKGPGTSISITTCHSAS